MRAVCNVASDPMRSVSPCCGRHLHREPDSPDVDDGDRAGHREHGAAHGGDHGATLRLPVDFSASRHARCAGVSRWPSARRRRAISRPPRQAWQIARASASAASAGVGTASRPQHPRHHGAHLRLVGGAVAGDRGLHLARGVQPDGETVLGAERQRDAARLRRAHHGAEVVLREYPLHGHRRRAVLGEHEADAPRDGQQALGERQRRAGSARRRRRREWPGGSARHPRCRCRNGSVPGRFRARACITR